MSPVHEDIATVFVDGFLGVSGRLEVLDDDRVVNSLAVWIEKAIFKEIVDAARLARFLRLKLAFLGKVFSIVVAQVVVGNTTLRLDAGRKQKVYEVGLELSLASLEVVANHERLGLHRQYSRHERILGGAVNEGSSFQQ